MVVGTIPKHMSTLPERIRFSLRHASIFFFCNYKRHFSSKFALTQITKNLSKFFSFFALYRKVIFTDLTFRYIRGCLQYHLSHAEAAVCRCSSNRYSRKLRSIHRKTPVLKYLQIFSLQGSIFCRTPLVAHCKPQQSRYLAFPQISYSAITT